MVKGDDRCLLQKKIVSWFACDLVVIYLILFVIGLGTILVLHNNDLPFPPSSMQNKYGITPSPQDAYVILW